MHNHFTPLSLSGSFLLPSVITVKVWWDIKKIEAGGLDLLTKNSLEWEERQSLQGSLKDGGKVDIKEAAKDIECL